MYDVMGKAKLDEDQIVGVQGLGVEGMCDYKEMHEEDFCGHETILCPECGKGCMNLYMF